MKLTVGTYSFSLTKYNVIIDSKKIVHTLSLVYVDCGCVKTRSKIILNNFWFGDLKMDISVKNQT